MARLVAVHVAGERAQPQPRQVSKARGRHVSRYVLARWPRSCPLQACTTKPPLPQTTAQTYLAPFQHAMHRVRLGIRESDRIRHHGTHNAPASLST